MKLLIFYRSLRQGGVQRMMVNFANHMSDRGVAVTLLLISKEGEFLPMINSGVTVKALESKGNTLLSLVKELKTGGYDAMFTATPTLNIISILAKKISGVTTRVVISERSDTMKEFVEGGVKPYKLAFLLIPFLYRSANSIVAVSKGVASKLTKFALIDSKKINVIYNPAFDRSLQYQVTERIVNEPWLAQKDAPVILAAGRLATQKNFPLLIKAFNILIKKGWNLRLIIVGEGPLKDEIQQQIEDLRLKDRIKLVGFVPNPITWIANADVFVMSSAWEGFGNILVDALAAGTTIVSTNCKSGPSEILMDGKYGYLTETFDPEDMAEKIEKALKNPMPPELLRERAADFEKSLIMSKYEALLGY